ncbi:MAG: hypothetical protein EBR40_02360 [Proteobacteria bacterium]|jgi:hypothetical protein|nr:hypothetical protein [Pseudomonadota bacterium]
MKHTLSLLAVVLLSASTLTAADSNGCCVGPSQFALPESPSSMPVLLGLEPVRKDLKLSSLQEALLDSLRAEYKAKVGVTASTGLLDPKSASKCEADLNSWRLSYNKRALRILSPAQQTRLREIERQMLKGYFLNSPSEQKLLGFTPIQTKKAADITTYDRQQASRIMADFHAGKVSHFKKDLELHRLQSMTARSMMHLLTPEQQRKYLGLTGPKLKL